MLKKIKLSIIPRLCIPIIILCGLILFCLVVLGLYQTERIVLEELINHGLDTGEDYVVRCKKALKEKKDLLLISYLNEITKRTDVNYAMVLNGTGRIIAHNQVQQWGKIYRPEETKQVLSKTKPVVYDYIKQKIKYFDILFPMKSADTGNILLIGISSARVKQKVENLKRLSLGGIVLFLVVLIFLISYITKKTVTAPLKELNYAISAVGTANISEKGKVVCPGRTAEFDQLNESLTELSERILSVHGSLQQRIDSQQRHFSLFLQNIGQFLKEGVIFGDENNKIVYVNAKAKQILKISGKETGYHVLEVIKDFRLLKLIKDSSSQPNKIISGTTEDNHLISIVSVVDSFGEKKSVGMIILIQGGKA